ncbi:MAG: NUDIX hydrolase [Acidimicrobiia bacterium]
MGTVFSGRIFEVSVNRTRLPNGRVVDIEVVRHPGSVVILPVPDPDHLILVRQYRYAIDRWIWEFPAGSLKPHEDPVSAARRECQEEIGLVPEHLVALGEYFPTPGFCDERMIFYKATALRQPAVPVEPDEDECIERQYFSRPALAELVRRGEIQDMKTALGLALLSWAE